MSPLRILIIAVLLYIAYRLIFGGSKKRINKKNSQGGEKPGKPPAVEDVLVECNVCKTLVPRQQAVQLEHEGKTIYFCKKECHNAFVSEKGEEE